MDGQNSVLSGEEKALDTSIRDGAGDEEKRAGDGSLSDVGQNQTEDRTESSEAKISEDEAIKLADEAVAEGIGIGFFSVNGRKIKRDFPKSFKDLIAYCNGRSHIGELDADFIIGSLAYAPRTLLYEFFDSNNIFVNFTYIEIGPSNWKYTIAEPGALTVSTDLYKSRIEAEVAAFDAAFKKLENQLT